MIEYDNRRAMILAIGYFGLMILLLITLVILPVSAAIQTNKIEIRGTVVSQDIGSILNPLWDAQSFAGFFYDIRNNQNTEYLNITGQTLSELNDSRTIGDKNLTYQTGKADVEFNVHIKEGLPVIYGSAYYGDTYPIVGWKGEKWIAVKGNVNKLTKLAFEMGKNDKKTLTTGETWALGSGYELTINAVDSSASPNQVWFSLKKDGALIDDGISSEDNVYYKTQTIMGESNTLLFAVYVDSIFPDMVQFKYAWLTDADSAIEIRASDTFDAFKVIEASKDKIVLESNGSVSLSKNTDVKLLGNIAFKIADSDNLRFYPYVEYTAPGTYEMRGKIYSSPEDGPVTVNWDAQSFAGFFYDINNNQKTEYLNITGQDLSELNITRTIGEKNLVYQTGKAMVEFKVHEKEGKNVIDTSEFYKDKYPVVGWKGEKWIAVKGNANKLTKLAFEMGNKDKKNLTTGETWALGSGYELTINAVDANASPRQVWFSLKKDGALIDDGISSEDNVYYKTQTIMGESNTLLFAVYVDSIFPDMVQFKYAWLTDADSAIEINASDTFDAFKVREASKDKIVLENDFSVSLSKNTDIKLLGDIAFKIADSDNLSFFPKVDYVIMNYSTSPNILVKTPNKGENWLRGTTKKIKWSSVGDPGANVKIELLKGGLVNEVIASSTPNNGSFSWTISSTHTLGNDYKISIESTTNSSYKDVSNKKFIISTINCG